MGNELVPVRPAIPKVVDQDGNPVVGPEMEKILGLVTQMAQTAQLVKIRKSLERQQITGHKKTIILNANGNQQFLDLTEVDPYTPCATAKFLNMSRDFPVYISVNDFFDFTQIWPNGELPFDFTQADERIRYIIYKCDQGQAVRLQLLVTY